MARFRFLVPPRLRTLGGVEEDRRATWLELFFDLVIVVAVGEVARTLVEDPSAAGLGRFAALFVPVWWVWVGVTFYADRFDTDDVVYRALVMVEMLAVAALASNTHDALHGGSAGYSLSFVAARVVLIALYARAWRHVPEARGLITLYTCAFTVGSSLWAVSLLFPTPTRYVLWGIGLALDMATPLVARRFIAQAPFHTSHIPERVGLFAIIVLGESVIAVVAGTAGTDWNARALVAAVGGFAVAAAIWWIYFDTLDTSIVKRSIAAGQIYIYFHLPLLGGLAAAGAGVEIAIEDAAHGGPMSAGARWALCGGIALCLLSMAVIHLTATHAPRERDLWLRVAAAGVPVALAPAEVSVLVVVPVLAGALAALVALELTHEEHAPVAAKVDA